MNNEFKWDETLCFNFKLVEQSHEKRVWEYLHFANKITFEYICVRYTSIYYNSFSLKCHLTFFLFFNRLMPISLIISRLHKSCCENKP